jgi:hypothetical protein
MIALLKWITDNNYVRYKDDKWYKPGQFPTVYLKIEQLIELYECTNL